MMAGETVEMKVEMTIDEMARMWGGQTVGKKDAKMVSKMAGMLVRQWAGMKAMLDGLWVDRKDAMWVD